MTMHSPDMALNALAEAIRRSPVPVGGSEYGVHLGNHWWSRDPSVRQINLIGAYLTMVQPDPSDAAPDPLECAAQAAGVPPAWLLGVSDGFAGLMDEEREGDTSPRGLQYRDGWKWGKRLREEFTKTEATAQ